jgi:iron(III) transport system ATP-binding protein
MTSVDVRGLGKTYGPKSALNDIDLEIRSGEFVTLLGPSGCGKTTTLRCLAGLERPTQGRVVMGDRVVVDIDRRLFVPPEKRHVGMVFQSYALWPHMTVAENVSYPLKVARVSSRERTERVADVLETVGMGALSARQVTALSGGQQQRVALARALVGRPGIIFFDEPLSNLDTKLRYQMGQQVRALHDRFQTTSVYVTHDQEEAITLSDRILVMNQGSIEQDGSPEELYDRPVTAFVADFMGFSNIRPGVVVGSTGAFVDVRLDGSQIVVTGTSREPVAIGTAVDIAFRAGHAVMVAPGAGGVSARVLRSTYLGSAVNLLVDASGVEIRIRVDVAGLDSLGGRPMPGDDLVFEVNRHRAVVLPRAAALGTERESSQPISAFASASS